MIRFPDLGAAGDIGSEPADIPPSGPGSASLSDPSMPITETICVLGYN